jgi:hypothetical protein
MTTLTIRFDIAEPRFTHQFVYEGGETERAALKEAMRKLAANAGMDLETWLTNAVVRAPDLLTNSGSNVRQGLMSAVTAWALDLSAGHPTRHGTIGEFLNGYDFLVTITRIADGEISCQVNASGEHAGTA